MNTVRFDLHCMNCLNVAIDCMIDFPLKTPKSSSGLYDKGIKLKELLPHGITTCFTAFCEYIQVVRTVHCEHQISVPT